MLEQTVEVTAVEADSALVRRLPSSQGCSACSAGRGCGAAWWSQLRGASPVRIRLAPDGPLPVGIEVGEQLLLTLRDGDVLRSALWVYAVPLAGLVSGAAVGQGLGGGLADATAAALGLSGLAGGALLARHVTRRLARRAGIVALGRQMRRGGRL